MRFNFFRRFCVICLMGFACFLGFGGIASAVGADSQQTPIVRMEILPNEVLVGEPIELRITILAPTWFPKPPVYPSFEMPNVMTRLPADSSYAMSERVGDATWSGIVRSYEIIPLVAATYRLDARNVGVTWSDPETRSPLVRALGLPDVEFRAVVPVGAEALDPYLAGRALTVRREIEGGSDGVVGDLSVGDAIVVHYVAELEGMAAVFLPPLFSNPRVEGAAVYASLSIVEDDGIARRIETLTFVLEESGELILPGIELEWWNTATRSIETASVQESSLPVSGTLLSMIEPGSVGGNVLVGSLCAGLGLAGLTWRRWRPWLRAHCRMRAERRLHSEAHAFRELARSLRSGEARAIHHALLGWLDRLQPGIDVRGFVHSYGDAALEHGVENVIATVYANGNVGFDCKDLEARFVAVRSQLKRKRGFRDKASSSDLPSLNR